MKKLLLILAIGAFAACNDSAKSTDEAVDSKTEAMDSMSTTTDESKMMMDTSGTSVMDTTKAKADSLKN